jgi:hypothetical protein
MAAHEGGCLISTGFCPSDLWLQRTGSKPERKLGTQERETVVELKQLLGKKRLRELEA